MAIGAAIGSATGAFFGDKAGDILGKKFGEWTNDLRQYDLPNKIMSYMTGASNLISGVKEKRSFSLSRAASEFRGGGNITGLSDTQTRALAADTQRTESMGNRFAENRLGYLGRYQFGAAALADVGLIDKDKLSKAKKAGFKGGQKKFLSNNENWLTEGGKQGFLKNAEMQDRAFVKLSNLNIKIGKKTLGLKNNSAESIAGYVKAAHLKGTGGANKLFKNGIDNFDANGTSAAKYANDGVMAIRRVANTTTSRISRSSISSTPGLTKASKNVGTGLSSNINPIEGKNIINSKDDKKVTVIINDKSVEQDVKDRTIAHIASGGFMAM